MRFPWHFKTKKQIITYDSAITSYDLRVITYDYKITSYDLLLETESGWNFFRYMLFFMKIIFLLCLCFCLIMLKFIALKSAQGVGGSILHKRTFLMR